MYLITEPPFERFEPCSKRQNWTALLRRGTGFETVTKCTDTEKKNYDLHP
jgi:hypothetical protein